MPSLTSNLVVFLMHAKLQSSATHLNHRDGGSTPYKPSNGLPEEGASSFLKQHNSFLGGPGKGGFRERPEKVPQSAPVDPPTRPRYGCAAPAATLVSAGGKPRPRFFMTRGK